jgi:hypothetical protein
VNHTTVSGGTNGTHQPPSGNGPAPTTATTGREHHVAELDVALPGTSRLRAVPTRQQETQLSLAALRIILPLALIVGIPATLLRGTAGLATALFVLALVVGVFVLTGFAHGWAGRRSLVALQTVAMAGVFIRLLLYGVLLAVLRPIEVLDPVTLAVATPIVVFALLAFEARYVSSRREFLFLDLAACSPVDRKECS